jgi:hypothetical protein
MPHPLPSARPTLTSVWPASSRIARTFSLMKSTPSTATAWQPASAILTAASAITRLSLMWTCGHCSAAALSTPCTCGSM